MSHDDASSAESGPNETFAAQRPGRATAGCSFRISSFVVTSTSTRSPWPIRPSTTLRKRERPWPMTVFASGVSNSPVSSSTSSRQPFSCPFPTDRREVRCDLAHLLDHAAAVLRPAARLHGRSRLLPARLHEHVHQVVRVLAEERIGIDDVVEAAPVAPLPRERPQREGLPRAGVAVPEHELSAVRRPEALHQPIERGARRCGVVRRDLVPLGDGDRPP